MNKGELVDAVAESVGLTKKQANAAVSAVFETVMNSVAEGNKVTIIGFGTFEPRERQERESRNPKTGEALTIPAKTVPAFSAGKQFKDLVA